MRLADLPCLADLVFVGNPLEEKHSAEGTWMDEACKRLPNLKKLDGKRVCRLLYVSSSFFLEISMTLSYLSPPRHAVFI